MFCCQSFPARQPEPVADNRSLWPVQRARQRGKRRPLGSRWKKSENGVDKGLGAAATRPTTRHDVHLKQRQPLTPIIWLLSSPSFICHSIVSKHRNWTHIIFQCYIFQLTSSRTSQAWPNRFAGRSGNSSILPDISYLQTSDVQFVAASTPPCHPISVPPPRYCDSVSISDATGRAARMDQRKLFAT